MSGPLFMGEGCCLTWDEGKNKCQTSEIQKQINDLIKLMLMVLKTMFNLGQCKMQSVDWG